LFVWGLKAPLDDINNGKASKIGTGRYISQLLETLKGVTFRGGDQKGAELRSGWKARTYKQHNIHNSPKYPLNIAIK
jgi:hypothetical protein